MARPTRAELPGLFHTLDPKTGLVMLSHRDADFLGRVMSEAERLGKWSASPPLLTNSGPEGRALLLGGNPTSTSGIVLPGTQDASFFAQLRGSAGTGTSPYGFDQVEWNGSSWSVVSGGVSSGTGAIEAAGKANLGGKVVRLRPLDGSNWYFEWIRAASCGPCSLPYGSSLNCSYVTYDAYCNPTTRFNTTLTYCAGSISSPFGGGSLGYPNSPGYWDSGCVSISPSFICTQSSGPTPGTYTFSHARVVVYCSVGNSHPWLGTVQVAMMIYSDAICEWPCSIYPQTTRGNTDGDACDNAGFPGGVPNWINCYFGAFGPLEPEYSCKPLFLQGTMGAGGTCPPLMTLST